MVRAQGEDWVEVAGLLDDVASGVVCGFGVEVALQTSQSSLWVC